MPSARKLVHVPPWAGRSTRVPTVVVPVVILACALVLSGCTSGASQPSADTSATTGSAGTATASPDVQPGDDALPTTEVTPSPTPEPEPTVPLVLATHLTLPAVDLSQAQMRALLVDGPTSGVLPIPGGASPTVVVAPSVDPPEGATQVSSSAEVVEAVRQDRSTVGLLPADALDPTVRAVRVDGVDPLRSPDEYPVTTEGSAPDAVVTISIGGDVMADRRVGDRLAQTGDYAGLLGPIAERLAASDIAMVNLESTLAELGPPTQGIESFVADPRVRDGLAEAGVDVVSLANNHSGDYGPESLLTTIDLLRDGGFAVFGAGESPERADRPAVLIRDGVTVAFVGFNAIGETPAAAPGQPGASALSMPPRTGPLDRDRLAQLEAQVADLAERVDVVIVVPHWGQQYTPLPVPEQSEVGQALLAAGADIVVGGHPHWVQAIERDDRGRLVVHSLGNLVFDMDFSVETMEGVVAELVVWDDRVVAVDHVPYVIGTDWVPRWVSPTERGDRILTQMWDASTQPFASRS